jgi:hypothetical protein
LEIETAGRRTPDAYQHTACVENGRTPVGVRERTPVMSAVPEDPKPDENGEDEDEGASVAELRDLVWDADFAGATGAVAAIVVLGVGIFCAIAASRFVGDDATADDVASLVTIVGLFVGAVMIVTGAWILALEMRGRAPHDVKAPRPARAIAEGLGKDEIEAVTGLVRAVGGLRGAFALVVVGALLIGGMALLADRTSDGPEADQPGSVPASTSTTTG